jgi:hypothetical protein
MTRKVMGTPSFGDTEQGRFEFSPEPEIPKRMASAEDLYLDYAT